MRRLGYILLAVALSIIMIELKGQNTTAYSISPSIPNKLSQRSRIIRWKITVMESK
jgi:hypothetical protein